MLLMAGSYFFHPNFAFFRLELQVSWNGKFSLFPSFLFHAFCEASHSLSSSESFSGLFVRLFFLVPRVRLRRASRSMLFFLLPSFGGRDQWPTLQKSSSLSFFSFPHVDLSVMLRATYKKRSFFFSFPPPPPYMMKATL